MEETKDEQKNMKWMKYLMKYGDSDAPRKNSCVFFLRESTLQVDPATAISSLPRTYCSIWQEDILL